MSASVLLGLVLAVCCSVVALLGFLFKQRGAAGAPAVEWRHPVRSTVALFSNRWWTLGILVAMAAWVFHVAALALAPISLVQSVIAGGLVLLTPLADKVFGIRAPAASGWASRSPPPAWRCWRRRSGRRRHAYDSFEGATLWTYVAALTVGAVVCCVAVLGDTPRAGVVLAISAGLLWGGSDVAIKAAAGDLAADGLLVLLTPEALVITVLSLVGLVVSARSLQLGPAVAVIALTSVAANVVTIASGASSSASRCRTAPARWRSGCSPSRSSSSAPG